jgi:antitoxin YefM
MLKKTNNTFNKARRTVPLLHKFGQLTMKTINFAEEKDLGRTLDQVATSKESIIISRRDADDAVVMTLDHYNSLIETIYLLKSPANAAHLAKSLDQYHKGQTQQGR